LGLAKFVRFENGIDTFFLGGVDERAGVDDDHVGAGGVIGDFDAALHQRTEHDLGIDQVLGATEADQADANWLLRLCLLVWDSLRHEPHNLRDVPKQAMIGFATGDVCGIHKKKKKPGCPGFFAI
jgi:hypothetical protein